MLIRQDFGSRSKLCDPAKKRHSNRRSRLHVVLFIALLWSGLVVCRLSSLQFSDSGRWRNSAAKQHTKAFSIAQPRAPIVDREGRLLSVSVPAGSIFIRPQQLGSSDDRSRTKKELSKALLLDEQFLNKKFNEKSPFVWISRQIPKPTADAVRELKLPGVDYVLESRRYYPFGNAASTLIGKVGIDGNGLTGLESIYDKLLRGDEAKSSFVRDGFGNMIEAKASLNLDKVDEEDPQALRLTIDGYLQQIVDEETAAGRIKANAARALAVLVDSDSGDILAMSQSPNIDYNSSEVSSNSALKNFIVETVYEPGSTFKPLVAAAALDAGVVYPGELIDCEKGRYVFGGHVIKDVHPSAVVSFKDVIVRSSNIGISKVGAKLGAESLYRYIKNFGFGEATHLGLPGESGGIFRNVKSWAKIDIATHSFGQGIAVTPLQMVRAMSAIANDGLLPNLRVIADDREPEFKRVVGVKAAKKVKEFMYGVVENEKGTGSKAAIQGIRVAGKTGTAQKARLDGRGYDPGKYVASFLGFVDGAPVGVDRTLSLIVLVDEPNTDSIYGGTLAAPVFQRIMQRSLAYLGMSPELRKGANPGYIVASDKERNRRNSGHSLADAEHEYGSGKS